MKLSDILSRTAVVADLKGRDKKSVLAEFAERAVEFAPHLEKEKILEILLNREQLGSTAVGHGVAIPHGKIAGLDHIVAIFGRSTDGIDFQAHDEQLTHLFFVLLAPETAIGNHLQALARLSRLLKDNKIHEQLLAARAEELYDILITEDNKI